MFDYLSPVKLEGRTLKEIEQDLIDALGRDKYNGVHMMEYFTANNYEIQDLFPKDYRWIACFPVTGGSEGHYIHVDLILQDDKRLNVFLGKTFQGLGHAIEIAAKLARLMGV